MARKETGKRVNTRARERKRERELKGERECMEIERDET